MSIVFSYKVNAVRVADQGVLKNVVKEVDATVSGADGEARFDLPVSLKLLTVDPQSFTEFDDLTEAQVVSWLEDMPELEPTKAHIAIVVEREAAKLASKVKPLPWVTAEPTP